jgi:tetratricopeptide (TPR) repeat protein
MRTTGSDSEVATLRRRAEQAIAAARPREQLEGVLEAIVARCEDGSDDAVFAHRQLAELRLEESPWAAALHLRRVLQFTQSDDIAHALMGLCQALQGNYRMAVGSYRKAVAIAPGNPWYNHNLGHLLDVAAGAPDEALVYLRKAHRAQPQQEEVGASLAHCLGRLGRCEEGLALTRALLAKHPRHKDLTSLLGWLEAGAPARDDRAAASSMPRRTTALGPKPEPAVAAAPAGDDAVHAATRKALRCADLDEALVERALRLWSDLLAAAPRERDPVPSRAWIAAIEYALARIDGRTVGQQRLAERHGIHPSTLSARYGTLRVLLNLLPRDARYVAP